MKPSISLVLEVCVSSVCLVWSSQPQRPVGGLGSGFRVQVEFRGKRTAGCLVVMVEVGVRGQGIKLLGLFVCFL